MKKTGLGRGLDELLPMGEDFAGNTVKEIPIGDIDPNEAQPRRAFTEESLNQLAQSIREAGVLQPILVVEIGTRYRIVAGERRWRAARLAGLMAIPCIVKDMDRRQQMEAALIENLQREDLNPMEEAAAIRALMQQCGYTQDAAAKRLGKSRPAIANTLRLLNLPLEVTDMVRKGTLSAGHARVLAGMEEESRQIDLARQTMLAGLSVRQLEQFASKPAEVPKPKPTPKPIPVELSELEVRLRETIGVRTTFSGTMRRGKIVLQYYSADELERLFEALERMTKE
jgi:ParB family transcriptional regulator, chromosome partitioning protein